MRPFSSRSKHVQNKKIKHVPNKRLNQVKAGPVGLVAESESEDEEDTSPQSKREQILSEVCSLNRRGSESCSYIRGKVSNKDVFALILVDTGNTTQNDIICKEFFKLTYLPLIQSKEMTLWTADRTGGGEDYK